MASRVALLAVVLVVTAGCATPSPDGPVADVAGIDLSQELLVLPQDRPVAASMRLHEEIDPSVADLGDIDGDMAWDPRDLDVTFHGIQEVYDEFARPVPAFVFRVPEMVFVQDQVTFGTGGIDIDGHYEVHDYEYAFDASDGRALGITDVTSGVRVFADPDFRHPFSGLAVFFMAFKQLGDDLTRETLVARFQGHDLLYRFEPYDGERPLPGDCAMWELTSRFDPPLEDDALPVTPDEDLEEESRTLACLEPGQSVPLWTYAGKEGEAYRLTRVTEAFQLPDYRGEVLAPVTYTTAAWEETRQLLPLSVPAPMLVPPSEPGGTWARAVADRAASLQLSPGYVLYRQDSDTPYLDLAWVGLPDLSIGVLNVTIPLVTPIFDSMSWIMLTDGSTTYSTFVHTREGTQEEPDVHVADPQGTSWDDFFGSPGADSLPPLVPDAPMEGQLADLAPEEANEVIFMFVQFDGGTTFAEWTIMQKCTAQADGFGLGVNGLRGSARFLARIPAGDDMRCTDGAFLLADPLPDAPGQVAHWALQAPAPQRSDAWSRMMA